MEEAQVYVGRTGEENNNFLKNNILKNIGSLIDYSSINGYDFSESKFKKNVHEIVEHYKTQTPKKREYLDLEQKEDKWAGCAIVEHYAIRRGMAGALTRREIMAGREEMIQRDTEKRKNEIIITDEKRESEATGLDKIALSNQNSEKY
jgi:hypothetical protein